MKIKTAELTGLPLTWATAKALGEDYQPETEYSGIGQEYPPRRFHEDRSLLGFLITEGQLSIIRCDDDYVVNKKGFTTSKRIPVWAATYGTQHGTVESHNGYGEPCGTVYEVSEDACSYGPTPSIAACRSIVAHKFGDEVDVPDELIGELT